MLLCCFHRKGRGAHSKSRSDEGQAGATPPNLELHVLANAPQATPQKPDDLWLMAEQKLKKDEKLGRILAAAYDILETDFQFRVSSNTSVCDQLCNFLDAQARELEEKKWMIKLGEHSIEVQELLKRTFQNILKLKEVVNTAASASAPAAIACAGVMVSLQLVVQAVEQHEHLLQGLETTSAMLPRLRLMEDLYLHPSAKLTPQLINEFTETLTSIYSKVIEFQARALCYLRKHSVSRLFRDLFKQDGWEDLVQDMQRLEDSAESFTSLMESAELRKRLDDIQDALSKDQIWRTTSERDERVKRLFRLFYTCPYRDRKDRNSKHVPGTCKWFTNHVRFQNWEQSNQSGPLWVSADPGCGKSVLSKFLVDEFFVSGHRRRTVCYFFFKDDFADQKTAANALSAILRQLFMAQPHLLPDSVLEKLDTDGDKLVESFFDLWDILISVARNVKTQNLNFLLTSRPYDHIRRGFKELEDQLPTIHLSGEGETEIQQISHEIDLVIKKRVEDISKKNDLRPDECSYLQEQLTSVPNRTYLWVSLTLDVVENMTGFTRGNIREAIQNLPPTVDDAYGRILDRSPDKLKARRLLQIIIAAERPLSLRELSLALAFNAGHQSISDIRDELETDDGRFKRTIRDLCGLFIVVIHGKVYLLHQTAREFLVPDIHSPSMSPNDSSKKNSWKHSFKLEDSQKVLATACMSYLLTQDIQSDPFHYFLEYAARCWPSHFRRAFNQDAQEAARLGYRLCQTGSNVFATWSKEFKNELPSDCTAISIASYFGLTAIVRLCLDTEIEYVNSRDPLGRTALSWAVIMGHNAVVKLLLDTGKVNVEPKGYFQGRTPLSWAATMGNEEVVKLLLETGKVNVNSKDNDRRTPLSLTTIGGHETVVELLLKTGKVDVNSKDNDGQTPLSVAALNGHEAVTKLLLKTRKVDINSKDNHGQTPLSMSATYGHEKVVKLLLETGKADVNSKDNDGRTPLCLAAFKGYEAIVKLLLDTGKVDINSKDKYGRTPLSWAMEEGHWGVVSLLERYSRP